MAVLAFLLGLLVGGIITGAVMFRLWLWTVRQPGYRMTLLKKLHEDFPFDYHSVCADSSAAAQGASFGSPN